MGVEGAWEEGDGAGWVAEGEEGRSCADTSARAAVWSCSRGC